MLILSFHFHPHLNRTITITTITITTTIPREKYLFFMFFCVFDGKILTFFHFFTYHGCCISSPVQPVTLNMGMRMPSWYDIYGLNDIKLPQDKDGLARSKEVIMKFIDKEIASGINADRIIVGGIN